jgi:peptidoglycan/xylan/chitin deacetylase (PgdA/CDA1 family)
VVSLDFELYWGIRDHVALDARRERLLGARRAVPRLLRTFTSYGVHATWATVGFLFLDGREELLQRVPARTPRYANRKLSPYEEVSTTGTDEESDPFHFAPSLVRQIAATPGQELGTHTFSHYYCLEAGQTREEFRHDLAAALGCAEEKTGRRPESLVFPRNQTNPQYLAACRQLGIHAYRGGERAWPYRAIGGGRTVRSAQRLLRLADAYLDLFGAHTSPVAHPADGLPVNVPSSRFLRPWSPSLRALEPLRVRRITSAMTHAARSGEVFHLWWHPHNFGEHQEENFAVLHRVLDHFAELRRRHGMRSVSMGEVARQREEESGLRRVPAEGEDQLGLPRVDEAFHG